MNDKDDHLKKDKIKLSVKPELKILNKNVDLSKFKKKKEENSNKIINQDLVNNAKKVTKEKLNKLDNKLSDVVKSAKLVSSDTLVSYDFNLKTPFNLKDYLTKNLSEFKNNFINLFKSRLIKPLLFSLVLGLFWFILSALERSGVNNFFCNFLSYLSQNRAGFNRGIIGGILGVISKGIFAYFLYSLVDNKGADIINGFKKLNLKVNLSSKSNLMCFVFSIGLSLVIYNVLVGFNSRHDNLMAIALIGIILESRNNSGMIYTILRHYITNLNLFINGLLIGLILSFIISLFNFGYLALFIGIILIIIVTILFLLSDKKNKEVEQC